MTELGDSLARMSFMQLLLLFAFVTHYMLAVGGMLGTKGRLVDEIAPPTPAAEVDMAGCSARLLDAVAAAFDD